MKTTFGLPARAGMCVSAAMEALNENSHQAENEQVAFHRLVLTCADVKVGVMGPIRT